MTLDQSTYRRALVVGDARLTKLLQREPEECASISEYATLTGIPTERILELLGPVVEQGVLGFEVWADQIFVNTAPYGRPTKASLPEVAPNLWELLRSDDRDVSDAYDLWRVARGLRQAGWDVEANPRRILFNMLPPPNPPALGIRTTGQIVPLVIHPPAAQLTESDGPLAVYSACGAKTVALLCDSGELDVMSTFTRKFAVEHGSRMPMAVLILEAPRFAPTLLRAGDASVVPRSAGGVSGR